MDDMPGMDGSTSSTMTMVMSGTFHFVPFDQLWFSGWAPATNGAMVGACVGLFLLAVVERWLAAMRGLSEVWWKRRTDALLARRYGTSTPASSESSQTPSIERKADEEADCCLPDEPSSIVRLPPNFPSRNRMIDRLMPPFILSHDLPRGVLQVGQAALGYALMLTVMTYNAGYFLAILAGLGFGEMLFGRYANHGSHNMTGSA